MLASLKAHNGKFELVSGSPTDRGDTKEWGWRFRHEAAMFARPFRENPGFYRARTQELLAESICGWPGARSQKRTTDLWEIGG